MGVGGGGGGLLPTDSLTHILLHLLFCRIRRAGYPIRHSFHDFVERYRILLPGLLLADVVDFKQTSRRICTRVLQERDWQIGHHKVFLKVCMYIKPSQV